MICVLEYVKKVVLVVACVFFTVMSFILNFIKSFLHSMLQLLSFGRSRLSTSLSVYVKTNTGSTLSVELDPKWDIKNVKELVAPQLGLAPDDLKIIFAGKELSDSTVIEECDLGQKSVLHAVKSSPTHVLKNKLDLSLKDSDILEDGSKPLSETLLDLQLTPRERLSVSESDKQKLKAHFYVSCSSCKKLAEGKLRVRCACCRSGAFTVHSDPQSWDDVLLSSRITGECHSEHSCSVVLHDDAPTFAEFYFKCSEHQSQGETDQAIPLYLIKPNLKEIPCLSCSDVNETVLVFPCNAGHVTCLECFRHYCTSRLRDRQFWCHPELGYTLPCPVGCENSFIEEIHHFRLMTSKQYDQYQRFATEEYVLQAGGVLCPQPGCGMGILADADCAKITCLNGCGYVFCRRCLQGFHLGECEQASDDPTPEGSCQYSVDPARVSEARWDEASKVTIRVISKPCPKCRTPTERSGGCMHMICTRAGCAFEWCWVCQTTWTRECMAAHWFG